MSIKIRLKLFSEIFNSSNYLFNLEQLENYFNFKPNFLKKTNNRVR